MSIFFLILFAICFFRASPFPNKRPSQNPRMSLSIVHNLAAPDYWTPEEHGEFSKRFRDDIRMKLLAMRAPRSSGAPCVPVLKPVTVLESLKLLEAEDFEVECSDGSAVKDVENGLRYLQSVPWWKMQPSVVLAALQFKPTTTTTTEDVQDDEVREVKRRRL